MKQNKPKFQYIESESGMNALNSAKKLNRIYKVCTILGCVLVIYLCLTHSRYSIAFAMLLGGGIAFGRLEVCKRLVGMMGRCVHETPDLDGYINLNIYYTKFLAGNRNTVYQQCILNLINAHTARGDFETARKLMSDLECLDISYHTQAMLTVAKADIALYEGDMEQLRAQLAEFDPRKLDSAMEQTNQTISKMHLRQCFVEDRIEEALPLCDAQIRSTIPLTRITAVWMKALLLEKKGDPACRELYQEVADKGGSLYIGRHAAEKLMA